MFPAAVAVASYTVRARTTARSPPRAWVTSRALSIHPGEDAPRRGWCRLRDRDRQPCRHRNGRTPGTWTSVSSWVNSPGCHVLPTPPGKPCLPHQVSTCGHRV